MESFCNGTKLWDTDLTWNNSWPEFTECFQNTILVWAASGWLWIVSPVYMLYLTSQKKNPNPVTWRIIAKIVLTILCLGICIIEIVTAVNDLSKEGDYWKAWLTGPVIEALTLILVLVYVILERQKGFVTSGVLFIYWTIAVITYIIPFYSKIIKKEYSDKPLNFIVFNVYFAMSIFQWGLFCVADETSIPPEKNECPEVRASFLSRITFWWMNRLMVTGYKNPLTEDNLFLLNPRDQSRNVIPRFEENWKKEKNRLKSLKVPVREPVRESTERTPLLNADVIRKDSSQPVTKGPSLLKVLFKTFGWDLLHAWIFKLFYDVLVFVYPQLLGLLIAYAQYGEHGETSNSSLQQVWKGYFLAAAFFLTILLQSFFFHQVFQWSSVLGLKVRAAIISAVYRKALTMSNQARKESTVGEIVNLMSVDTEHIQMLIPYMWSCWSSPLQIGVALYFLYQTVGYAMFAGLGLLILLFPINAFIMTKIHSLQEKQMKQKDNRIKLLTEVLNGIKILKLYAWEMSFKEKILGIRNAELKILYSANVIGCGFTFAWTFAPFMVSFATFATYVYTSESHYLDAQTAFVALTLLNILRFAINVAPMIITEMVKASVSLKRLGKFLNHDDIDTSNVSHNPSQGEVISIKKASFMWDPEIGECLKDITIGVPKGSLIAVVGQVGSGKSSMLSAILGEMIKVKGEVNVRGSVAYVPQQAWIQNETLQNNILFGSDFNASFYQNVVQACALKPDFDILPSGDATEIGEKGINLSGGQKQRVSVARAVYNEADIYLLDDPLSAVDSHVGKHIFDQVIGNTGLLQSKTRILVTHGLQWLPKVDRIIVIVDGQISEMGSYDELLDHAGAFADFLNTYLTEEKDDTEEDPEMKEVKEKILQRLTSITSDDGSDPGNEVKRKIIQRLTSVTSDEEGKTDGDHRRTSESESKSPAKLQRQKSVLEKEEKAPEKVTEVDKLIEEEKAEIGSVKFSVFVSYARAIGIQYFALIFICYGLYQTGAIVSNVWLSSWTEDKTLINRSLPANSTVYKDRNDFYLGIYGALGGGQAIFITLYALIFVIRSVTASRLLHERMIHTVLRSPMSFFDTTPVGRIVNRFSDDISTIDSELPMNFEMFLDCSFLVIGTLIVISYSTPWFMTLILPLGILYFLIQRFYISTSRQLKRLESKTRSPIYNHFSETIAGASVIRAFKIQDTFIHESEHRVDVNQQYSFASFTANRWLGFRLEFLGNCVILAAAIFAVIERGNISGGIVGLSISYALQITENLNWFVRMTSQLETNIVSVERVTEYTKKPTEADLINHSNRPSQSWPNKGLVEFRNYSTRYREGLDLVLKNIEAIVNPGEKIGIVGRTGAGKSSLTLAMFRLIEPASGSIIVDGENLAYLGLHDCRSKLTILPQDPVLFSGTLRMNLDPMENHTDNDLWRALEHAHLKEFVQSLPTKLEHDCGEGGQNLSVGQRQLVCLARSLLRKTKILILDEATAAVDLETDELIQETIKREFSECTVLTIAHRLNTVIDYDRIMVLDRGLVREFDTPQNLLHNTKSIFYQLAKDAGIV